MAKFGNITDVSAWSCRSHLDEGFLTLSQTCSSLAVAKKPYVVFPGLHQWILYPLGGKVFKEQRVIR